MGVISTRRPAYRRFLSVDRPQARGSELTGVDLRPSGGPASSSPRSGPSPRATWRAGAGGDLRGAGGPFRASAEEVLLGRPAQRRRARPVLLGHEALQAAHQHRGLARVLGPGQVGGAGHGVGRPRSAVARSVAAAASARPCQSSSGSEARRRRWPRRSGRAARRGRRSRPPPPPGRTPRARASPARSARAEASGSSGRSTSSPRSPAFDRSTPALAQTKPCRVSQISTPRRRAQDPRGLVEHRLDQPRVLAALLGASARASLARLDLRQPAHPALGLGHHLVRDHEHVAGGQVGRRGRREQRRQVVAGVHLGETSRGRQTSERGRGHVTVRPRRGPASRDRSARTPGRASGRAGAARRGSSGACPAAELERADQLGQVLGRVHVEHQRGQRARPTQLEARVARRRRAWRARLPGPKLGSIASGGASSRALVPVQWRSGTIATGPAPRVQQLRPARPGRAAACRPAPAARGRSRRPARGGCRCRPPRTGRPRAVAQHAHAAAARRRLGHAVGGHDHDLVEPGDVPQRGQHVGEHRLGERLARAAAERAGQPLLGGAEGS